MTFDEFRVEWLYKRADFDKKYGYQCMDLIEFYNRDVVGAPPLGGDAIDLLRNPQEKFYNYHVNTILYIPPVGAIAIWNGKENNGIGHTAIVITANILYFTSLDQNYPVGNMVVEVKHTYFNVAGFLVAKQTEKPLEPNPGNQELESYKLRVNNTIQNAINTLNTLK